MTTRHAPTPHEMSIADVAAVLGVSRSRAAEYAREGTLAYREVPGRTVPTERLVSVAHVQALAQARRDDRDLFRELRAAGWLTVAEIAAHSGRAPSTITRAIQADRVRAIQVRHETGRPYLVDPADLGAFGRR